MRALSVSGPVVLRLTFFGGLIALGGLAAWGLAALHGILGFLAPTLPGAEALPAEIGPYLAGAATYLLIGAAALVLGIGAIRLERWAPPLLRSFAWIWLLGGATMAALGGGLFDNALVSYAGAVPPEDAAWLRRFFVGAIGVLGIVLPAALLVSLRGPAVSRACAARHPESCWSDACPEPVLLTAVALAVCGLLFLPLAFHPVVPWFGRLLVGPTGAAAQITLGAACVALALGLYRQRIRALLGTAGLFLALGVSTVVTLRVAEPVAMLSALGYPRPDLFAAERLAEVRALLIWLTGAFTVASLALLWGLARHFPRGQQ